MTASDTSRYAGFILRFLAFCIDTAVLFLGLFVLQVLLSISMDVGYVSGLPQLTPTVVSYNLVGVLAVWLYYALFESSAWQATLGKRFCKIKVTDLQGQRISFWRATGRYFGKYLSTLIFCIGYLMILFTEKKQALHDLLASTLVIRN